jgi:hypothetical protein
VVRVRVKVRVGVRAQEDEGGLQEYDFMISVAFFFACAPVSSHRRRKIL